METKKMVYIIGLSVIVLLFIILIVFHGNPEKGTGTPEIEIESEQIKDGPEKGPEKESGNSEHFNFV